jgi:hypothetical protein
MPDQEQPKDLPTKSPNAAQDAREQARTYRSIFAGPILTFDDGTTMELPPHPNLRMFDEDTLAAYDELLFDVETNCDRSPDVWIPEQKVKDSEGNEITLPATLRRGELLTPLRKTVDGKTELVKPPHEVRLVRTILGDKQYQVLRSKTVNGRKAGANDVWRSWNERGEDLMERRDADPKSDDGAVDSAPVPAADTA